MPDLEPSPKPLSPRRLPPWLLAALLPLITILVYVPALRAGFVWDDDTHLLKHIVLEENGLFRAWFTRDAFVYYPVTWTSYWIEHRLWGLGATGYHVTNVLLHAACGLLVWRGLARLGIPGAWVAALVFALHPVNVETAAWITQRKNLLAMLFYLGAIVLYLRFEAGGRRGAYWSAVALFLLGMLSKGAIVALPVVLLLLAWWQRGRVTRADLVRSIPFFVVALGMSVVEVYFQYVEAGAHDVRADPLIARVAGVGCVVWFYVAKTLLPLKLAFVYPRWEIDAATVLAWLPNVALAVALGACFAFRKRWGRAPLFALLYFCITIFPATGFVHFYYLKYSFVADHYQYVSVVGVIALVVAAIATALARVRRGRSVGAALAAIAVLGLGTLTWRQASLYRDYETLFRDSIAKYPAGWMAQHNLANYLQSKDRIDEAIPFYLETLRYHPGHETARENLAQAYVAIGDRRGAERILRDAVNVHPGRADARYELAMVLVATGQTEEADAQLREAVRLSPDHPLARAGLGLRLFERGAYAEAAVHLDRALELAPSFGDDFDYRFAHAVTLRSTGAWAQAAAAYRACLELRPTSGQAMAGLAWILATAPDDSVRDGAEAVALADGVCRATGYERPRLLDVLAAAYAEAGRFDDATRTARQAVDLARRAGLPELAAEIEARLQVYESRRTHRDAPIALRSGPHRTDRT